MSIARNIGSTKLGTLSKNCSIKRTCLLLLSPEQSTMMGVERRWSEVDNSTSVYPRSMQQCLLQHTPSHSS
ncbi:hypothetical protein KCV00_g168, partial [Aureobasidium melanogenum]